uniref:Uncharacterized protein n=1 Tax=Setaria viridis TaxID=4556 RepID=A0A4U6UQB2_SETVI|nr:hypothetical protein SEVIR_5G367900v2 [Setaria viridis]
MHCFELTVSSWIPKLQIARFFNLHAIFVALPYVRIRPYSTAVEVHFMSQSKQISYVILINLYLPEPEHSLFHGEPACLGNHSEDYTKAWFSCPKFGGAKLLL